MNDNPNQLQPINPNSTQGDIKTRLAELTEEIKANPNNNQAQVNELVSLIGNRYSGAFSFMKGAIYVGCMIIALAQGRALDLTARLFGLPEVNVYLSLGISLVIGQISYKLADKEYIKSKLSYNLKLIEPMKFIESLVIAQISAKYTFGFNLIFFFILFLAKQLLG